MCGLAGIAGYGVTMRDMKFLEELMVFSSVRGHHGTGLASITTGRKKSVEVLKEAASSPKFCDWYGAALHDSTSDVYIGHTRWATTGSLKADAAHPFIAGDLVGAHNGTVRSYEQKGSGKTDSEMMFKDMNVRGIKTVLDGLTYHDAYAITVFDTSKERLYIARNDRRPLYIAFSKIRSVMYWGSELRLLKCAATDPDGEELDLTYFDVTPFKLFEINIEDIKRGNFRPFKAVDINRPEAPPVLDDQSRLMRKYGMTF